MPRSRSCIYTSFTMASLPWLVRPQWGRVLGSRYARSRHDGSNASRAAHFSACPRSLTAAIWDSLAAELQTPAMLERDRLLLLAAGAGLAINLSLYGDSWRGAFNRTSTTRRLRTSPRRLDMVTDDPISEPQFKVIIEIMVNTYTYQTHAPMADRVGLLYCAAIHSGYAVRCCEHLGLDVSLHF